MAKILFVNEKVDDADLFFQGFHESADPSLPKVRMNHSVSERALSDNEDFFSASNKDPEVRGAAVHTKAEGNLEKRLNFEGLIGKSAAMMAVFKIIEKVAKTNSTALITGESGTGKELIARAIHQNSHRAEKPMVIINCGAIPKATPA